MFHHDKDLDFATLLDSLKLEYTLKSTKPIIDGHLHRVQAMLNSFISSHSGVDSTIKNALSSLPLESGLRLITSPYVCELLMVREETSDPKAIGSIEFQIVQAIVAEIKRAVPDFDHPIQPLWTSTGDVVFDTEIRDLFPPLETNCGIALNYQSYAQNTGKAGIAGYSYDEALKHKERIETAKRIIEMTSNEALTLVDEFTTIIQFRKNSVRPNVVNSSSHTSIGLIRCDNFHKIHNDMAEIVDMLVHESIHQFLHLFEEEYFAFVDVNRIPSGILGERNYASPWSGNLLDLRSYTHAILVWFGLCHFWGAFLDSDFLFPEITRAEAQAKLEESIIGFLSTGSVLDNLGTHKIYLSEAFTASVNNAQKKLKGRSWFTTLSTEYLTVTA